MIFTFKPAQYLYNLVLGFDQFFNTLLLGDPDDSFSGRCGKAMLSGVPKWWVPTMHAVLDWLFLVLFREENHCVNAVEPEELLEKELWHWYYK